MQPDKKQHQSPMTIDEQIENLKLLGLTIHDEGKARELLNDISYFRLIKAYSIGLKPRNGMYYDGISFDQIVELYMFNADFRQLLFAIIEQVEINLRCRIGNYFSNKYGIFGYRDACHFRVKEFHSAMIADIDKEIGRNRRAPFIRNFKDNYDPADVPFYAVVEIISFGALSKFYKNMNGADKAAIADIYGVPYVFLESWIESIAYVRNLCAHYGRLYNARLTKTPALFDEYSKNGISSQRVFGVLCCIKHLVPHDDNWTDFIREIEDLFKKYSAVNKATMGFPDNWKIILQGAFIFE